MRPGEDLAGHDALDEALHSHRRHQRERPVRVHRRKEPSRIRPGLVAVEAVAHPVLDLLDRDPGICAQLDGALADAR